MGPRQHPWGFSAGAGVRPDLGQGGKKLGRLFVNPLKAFLKPLKGLLRPYKAFQKAIFGPTGRISPVPGHPGRYPKSGRCPNYIKFILEKSIEKIALTALAQVRSGLFYGIPYIQDI
jgi:hypothetical protein